MSKIVGLSTENRTADVQVVEVEEGVETIDGDAFEECTSLKSVKLPQSLWEIGSYGNLKDAHHFKKSTYFEGMTAIHGFLNFIFYIIDIFASLGYRT